MWKAWAQSSNKIGSENCPLSCRLYFCYQYLHKQDLNKAALDAKTGSLHNTCSSSSLSSQSLKAWWGNHHPPIVWTHLLGSPHTTLGSLHLLASHFQPPIAAPACPTKICVAPFVPRDRHTHWEKKSSSWSPRLLSVPACSLATSQKWWYRCVASSWWRLAPCVGVDL
jgi:hypothetical protein